MRKAAKRAYGHMTAYDPDRQSGMIQPEDDGPSVSFSSAGMNRNMIKDGQAVRFDIVAGEKAGIFKAINITRA